MGREPIDGHGGIEPADDEHVVGEEWEAGEVRRAPRSGRIFFSSVLAGLLVAAIHTWVTSTDATPSDPFSSRSADIARVFGALALVWVAVALLLAATLVLVLDRLLGRHVRPVITEHTTVIRDDLTSPMTDEPLPWMREPGADGPRPDGPRPDDQPPPRAEG